MEVGIFILVVVVAMFFTYLSFSKTVDQTEINQALAGALWAIASGNVLVIRYFLANDTPSGFTELVKNSTYWQIILCVAFGMVSFGIFYQLAMDRRFDKMKARGLI